jgi:hypothetical protein
MYLTQLITQYNNMEDIKIDISVPVGIPKEESEKLFNAVADIDGAFEYFRSTLESDMKRYFNATSDEDRNMIRGAYNRTMYFYKIMKGKLDKQK